ncbi:MAG: hypothetical protein IJY96_08855 [Oscillospiraceae bacterium]|nr:hypothetical protein [Oscillospiraceae bacterium]
MKEKLLNIIRICFVACLAILVFAGLGRAVFMPKEVVRYENRKANLLPALSLETVLSVEYQDGVESALMDQIHGAELMKSKYNETDSGIAFSVLKSIFMRDPNRIYYYNGLLVRGGDALLYYPKILREDSMVLLDERAAEINEAAAANPEQDFYVYYVEKDTDINFDTLVHSGFYEHLASKLDPSIPHGVDAIADFEDYYRRFYKTDHHWNHIGSYECYLDLLPFLGVESEPIAIEGEYLIGTRMSGSKAAYTRSLDVWVEDMYGYYLNFPWMGVNINGWWSENYGCQNVPDENAVSYGGYYGDDFGQVTFNMDKPERENILVIGDSYDNAILKLIASHFNMTYSVDLRYYEHYMGEKFVLSDYIEEHDIDKVLIIGSVNFFLSEDFSLR